MNAGDLNRFINGSHNIEFFNIVKIVNGLSISLLDLFYYKGPLPDNRNFNGLVKKLAVLLQEPCFKHL